MFAVNVFKGTLVRPYQTLCARPRLLKRPLQPIFQPLKYIFNCDKLRIKG